METGKDRMCLENEDNAINKEFKESKSMDNNLSECQTIPKTIHMFWFGGAEKSEIIKKCIESWKEYAPNYKIIEWNEDNFDVNFCRRSKEAYEAKKWAFVADIARLKILYEQGGIYLDTDVRLYAPLDDLVDEVKGSRTFFLFLNERFIATGLGFGAAAGSLVIKYLLDNYLNMRFDLMHGIFNRVCTQIETEALEDYYPQFKRNDKTQCFSDGTIMLSTSVWSKYSEHIGTGTWVDGGRNFDPSSHRPLRIGRIKKLIRNPNIFRMVRKCLGRKAEYVYEFLTYDLLDMGIRYFFLGALKRVLGRLRVL